jgi:hypothetical protein
MRQAKGGRPTPEGAAQAGRQGNTREERNRTPGRHSSNAGGAKLNPSGAIIDDRRREWEV